MARKFKYYLGVDIDSESEHPEIIITEDEIFMEYWPFWKERMQKLGRHHLISRENCIQDWVTIHWAVEVKDGV